MLMMMWPKENFCHLQDYLENWCRHLVILNSALYTSVCMSFLRLSGYMLLLPDKTWSYARQGLLCAHKQGGNCLVVRDLTCLSGYTHRLFLA
jgi:hypothetical protein